MKIIQHCHLVEDIRMEMTLESKSLLTHSLFTDLSESEIDEIKEHMLIIQRNITELIQKRIKT